VARSFLFVMVFAVFVSCATVPAPEDQQLQVQRASDEFFAVRGRGDAAAFAAQFTDDGVFMVPGLPDSVGRTAIRELAQRRFQSSPATDFKLHQREIDVSGDTAHEIASFSETYQRDNMQMHGRYVIVWKRGAGNVWRVSRYLYNFSGAEPLS
jgi:uncharacterized protein (TIGR02246 family)